MAEAEFTSYPERRATHLGVRYSIRPGVGNTEIKWSGSLLLTPGAVRFTDAGQADEFRLPGDCAAKLTFR